MLAGCVEAGVLRERFGEHTQGPLTEFGFVFLGHGVPIFLDERSELNPGRITGLELAACPELQHADPNTVAGGVRREISPLRVATGCREGSDPSREYRGRARLRLE